MNRPDTELAERDEPAKDAVGATAADAQGQPGSASLLARVLIFLVRVYQVVLGPVLGGHCRYTPSCSVYFIQAVQKYGAVPGAAKGLARICRCHPFHRGGYDPP